MKPPPTSLQRLTKRLWVFFLRYVWLSARRLVWPYPFLHYPFVWLSFRGRYSYLAVTRQSVLVLEGAARSANQYCLAALAVAAGGKLPAVARLQHSPAQVKRGLAFGKPVLVLIRKPQAAARSLALQRMVWTPKLALKDWLRFYRTIEPLADQIVLADFARVIEDPGAVFRRVNARFGCNLPIYVKTAENEARVAKSLENTRSRLRGEGVTGDALPNPVKEIFLKQIDFSGTERLMAQAQELYRRLAAIAERQALDEGQKLP